MRRPLDPEKLDFLQKMPSLKGPALSILVAMIIAQRPLEAQELESFTGYQNQALTRGLKKLLHFRAIVEPIRGKGFYLTPHWQQMMLPLEYESNHENHDSTSENGDLNHDFHDSKSPINGGGGRSKLIKDPTTTTIGGRSNHENHDSPVDNFGESQTNYGSNPSNSNDAGVAEITAHSGIPNIANISRWLLKASIAPGSHHWEKILSMGHSEEYVKAHVLTLLAYQAGVPVPNSDQIGTGALIHRLQRGWGAPPMRCEGCLEVLKKCQCDGGWIPDEYKDIIRR